MWVVSGHARSTCWNHFLELGTYLCSLNRYFSYFMIALGLRLLCSSWMLQERFVVPEAMHAFHYVYNITITI